MAYRNYSADALKLLIEELTGKTVNYRYADIFNQHSKPKDNRTGNEIAEDVIQKCGLVVIE